MIANPVRKSTTFSSPPINFMICDRFMGITTWEIAKQTLRWNWIMLFTCDGNCNCLSIDNTQPSKAWLSAVWCHACLTLGVCYQFLCFYFPYYWMQLWLMWMASARMQEHSVLLRKAANLPLKSYRSFVCKEKNNFKNVF